MDVQVVATPDGELLWASGALPGPVHDTRTVRSARPAERIETAGLLGLADKGLCRPGPGVVFCPFKGPGKPTWQKNVGFAHATLRGHGERAIAQLKNWHRRARISRTDPSQTRS
ncbi:hypothetical protein NI17_004455 [Thermobifida halotolerans]|uniref:DDE Tnp4 domain-containing protein n=2 Tax=Thermobifida halotolerans TaxID=483545 RepID=A0AA97M4Y7_9ACTN|nr:hypothetical protein NI17_004455 [Thermobifida halotolerans]